jgi:hypothetical protein
LEIINLEIYLPDFGFHPLPSALADGYKAAGKGFSHIFAITNVAKALL